jgi:hypothetical protein
MSKPHIFVSCGQRTKEEKLLGEAICQTIRDHGVFDCFFAEAQHNLNGLHENILDALAKSDGFITAMHRRGNVNYGPDKHEPLDRASVWIEQEIAIAAYIQRTTKNDLLTAAYIEKGIGREGLRELLHLNPFEFTSNEEVIADIKERLKTWFKSSANDNFGELELEVFPGYESGIRVKHLTPILINKGSRANEYSCTLEIPIVLLSHMGGSIVGEQQRGKPGFRTFVMTEEARGKSPMIRESRMEMMKLSVAIDHLTEEQREQALKQDVHVFGEIGEREYSLTKSCAEIFAETQPARRKETVRDSESEVSGAPKRTIEYDPFAPDRMNKYDPLANL